MQNSSSHFSFSLAAIAAGFLLSLSPASSAVLVNYTFPSGSNASTASDPNVAVSLITSNIGIVGTDSGFSSSSSNAFARANATASSEVDAVEGADYFQFTLTPQGGYEVDLTSFSMQFGNQSSSSFNFASSFFVRTSLDNFGSNVAISPTGTTLTFNQGVATRTTTSSSYGSGTVAFDVSGTYQNLASAVTLRIYIFDNSDSGTLVTRFDNVVINGNVSPIPEPSAAGLTALGSLLALALRRSRKRSVS